VKSAFEILRERGFVKQCTDEAKLTQLLESEQVTFYSGFDPTAESLHCGHLLPIMAMAHLQRAGHVPIAIIGGGTAMVGDPSGKTEMRKMLTAEQIRSNIESIRGQFANYLNLDGKAGHFLDNGEWLLSLNYIDFLRDIGRYFRVNEMIKAKTYEERLKSEQGLSFIEFNYQLLQAYDFLKLFQKYNCRLQIGGDDQWSNILAGADLVRRLESSEAYGLTFPLLTTSSGAKMGKTAGGAVWLSAEKLSPFDYFQYWRNTHDDDVEKFLAMFTFLPIEDVRKLGKLEGAAINEAKVVLAYEATKLAHGEEAAAKAKEDAANVSQGKEADLSAVPSTEIEKSRLEAGIGIIDLFVEAGLSKSKSEARKLIQGGGAYVNGEKVEAIDLTVNTSHLSDTGEILLRSGKKKHHRIVPA